MEEILRKLYTDPKYPSAFAGINALYNEAKIHIPNITKRQIIDYLQKEEAYTLHKPRRIHFKRSKTIPTGYLTNVQVDLADFQKLSKYNKGYRYLLVAIDVLSRQMYAAPVKTKTFTDIKPAFASIFKQMPMYPHTIYSDSGGEFCSKQMREFFKEHEILKIEARASRMKASMAERAIKTIKSKLYRYFTHTGSKTWYNIVPKIINGINNTVCRSTGIKPIDINFDNAQVLWEKLYGKEEKKQLPRYKVGDKVRMSYEKGTFSKGYNQTFTDEIVQVEKAHKGDPPYYLIKDLKGEPMDARFYEQEVQKVEKDMNNYEVTRKIRSRQVNGEKEWLVTIRGYPGQFWVKLPEQ